jgi:hypothetical protein
MEGSSIGFRYAWLLTGYHFPETAIEVLAHMYWYASEMKQA